MKKIISLFFILLIAANVQGGNSAVNYAVIDSLALKGVSLAHRGQFLEALEVLQEIKKLYPDEPAGYVFTAAAYQTLIDSYRNEKYKDKFEQNIETAIQKADAKLKNSNPSTLDYFYAGASYGYRGIYRSFRGNWWGAFWDGGKGKKFMEKALELDSTLNDVYFALGSYHYWRSVKSKILWWLPFFGDQRKKGIEYTKVAISKGKFAKDEAKYALVRIYAEEKDYANVLIWADSVKKINPQDPYSRWFVGLAYIGLGKWEEAEKTYQELISICKSSPYYDLAAEVEARYHLALIYDHQNLVPKAFEQIGFILANQKEVENNDYARPFLEKARELKKKIETGLSAK